VVTGEVKASQGKGQNIELHATNVELLGQCDPESYVLGKQRVSLERLREMAHLRGRTNTFGAMLRIRNKLADLTHRFFQERDFLYLHTPIITASDCEGAGEMFQVTTLDLENPPRKDNGEIDYNQDFFARKANLTVSGQLEAETYACALGNVYTFGPTFRAEDSNTRRHLSEFWMIEPEMAFADLHDDADMAENFLRYLFANIIEACEDDLAFFNKRVDKELLDTLQRVASTPFARITHAEAVGMLRQSGRTFEYPVLDKGELQREHERCLAEDLLKAPVIVTDYPRECKAFYMRLNDDQSTVAAMDILLPRIGELVGGSQREDREDVLKTRMAEFNLNENTYWWYLDLRRFGTVPHAGFGVGFERLVQFCTGLQNIRDVIPFPRAPRQADF
jgi:asparaginyl-tRNA synthetase